MFESCFDRILNLEKELYSEYANKGEGEKTKWDSLFFNSIEELSFLTNEGYLDDPKMVNFFRPAIINWYENIYLKQYPNESKDSDSFPEMKKLYKKLKRGYNGKSTFLKGRKFDIGMLFIGAVYGLVFGLVGNLLSEYILKAMENQFPLDLLMYLIILTIIVSGSFLLLGIRLIKKSNNEITDIIQRLEKIEKILSYKYEID